MANQFLTSSFVLGATRIAAALLSKQLVATMLVNRDVEQQFVNSKTGGTVSVKYRPRLAATLDESTAGKTSLSTTDNQQVSVPVDATNYAYIMQEITTNESTHSLENFQRDILEPGINALAQTIDAFFTRRIAAGFARNLAGTAGTNPSTEAHIMAGRLAYVNNDAPLNRGPLVGLIGSAAESAFMQLDIFKNRDYGEDNAPAIRQAYMNNFRNIKWYMDQNVATSVQGDIAGTVLVNGGSQTGTSLAIDGFTAATGTVYKGTRFTINGDSTVYTVTEDTAIASNAISALPIYPALAASPSDNAAVTFQTAHTMDTIYHPDAVAGAVVAPKPLMGINSQIARFKDISLRLTIDSSTGGSNGAVDTVLMDAYIGCNVIRPEMGVIFQG